VRDRASGSELAQAYELLRAQAEGSVILDTRPKGLAAFLRGGMPEWMATWRRLLPVSTHIRSGRLRRRRAWPA
jgi:hypothetical protein